MASNSGDAINLELSTEELWALEKLLSQRHMVDALDRVLYGSPFLASIANRVFELVLQQRESVGDADGANRATLWRVYESLPRNSLEDIVVSVLAEPHWPTLADEVRSSIIASTIAPLVAEPATVKRLDAMVTDHVS